MEQSKALSRLLETADLVAMLEELTNPATVGRLSPSSLSGLRLTLHSVRESILSSHDVLAATLVAKSRGGVEPAPRAETATPKMPTASSTEATGAGMSNGNQAMKRNDLRASLERIIER